MFPALVGQQCQCRELSHPNVLRLTQVQIFTRALPAKSRQSRQVLAITACYVFEQLQAG